MLHVLIDTVFFTRPYSGISKLWETILANLKSNSDPSNNNYTITILLREGSQFKATNLNLTQKFNIQNIHAFNYASMDSDVDKLNHIAKTLKGDLFLSTYFTYCTVIPNLLTICDMIPEIFKMPLDPMWIQKDLAIKNATFFTTISDNTKRDLLKFYPYLAQSPYPIETIHIASTPSTYIDDSFLSSNNISQGSYILSVITNQEPYKNTKLITDFAAKYSEQLKTQLNSNIPIILVTKLATMQPIFKDNVLYITNVSDDLLASLYKNACAVIVPSLYEGFGLPIIEALQYETPVFAIQTDVFDEIVPDGGINYFENNVDDLYRVLGKLIGKDKEKIITKTKKASTYVKHKYTVQNHITGFEKLICNIDKFLSTPEPFINLVVQSYTDKLPARIKELETCILKNLDNPYIKTVWDLGNGIFGDDNATIKNHAKYHQITDKTSWLTYQAVFDFANKNAKNEGAYWCVCNLDIYLDYITSRWERALTWLNRDYVLSLSRHEWKNNGELIEIDTNFANILHSHTQDAWLFKTPLNVANCNFELGMLGCDNAINDRIVKSGYKILNAPKQFKIVHIDIAKGKNSTNFIEKHTNEMKNNKPPNKHPERTGCYLTPNYDQLCEMFANTNTGVIDLNSLAMALGADNMERYEFACKLFTSRIKIQNPD